MQYKWLYLLLYTTFSLSAQTITVKDQQTGLPLDRVSIISSQPIAFASTNSKGQADISDFVNSECIDISSLGYGLLNISYEDLTKQNFQVQLSSNRLTINEIVISANKRNQLSNNIASRIVSFSTKDVQLLQPQTAADLLGATGEVFIQKSQQGGGSPMIRGFATNRLLYTVDGVRMNNAIFRSGNLQNVISLDPFATEKTEVIFGPGSVIYGSDAIGGVMSFQTLTPQLSYDNDIITSGKLVYRHETANQEHSAHFDLNTGGKKWGMVMSLTRFDYDDLVMGSNGPDDYLRKEYIVRENNSDKIIANDNSKKQVFSGYTQMNAMQKVKFKPNKHWTFDYGLHYSATGDYSRYDALQQIKNNKLRFAEWNYGPQIWWMNQLNADYHHSNTVFDDVTLNLAHQYFEESRISRELNKSSRLTQTEKVNAYSLNLDFSKLAFKKLQWYYGAEVVYNDINSLGKTNNISTGLEADAVSRYPKSNWSSVAAYVSGQYLINPYINVLAGMRYNSYQIKAAFNTDYYSFPFTNADTSDGSLTGSVGCIIKPEKSWAISLNAATAFRSPNIDDMGKLFEQKTGFVTVPNPDLKAEYAYNVDLGIAKVIKDVFKIDVTGYYTFLDKAMVKRDFQLNGQDYITYNGSVSRVQAIQNASFAKVYGVQLGVNYKMPYGLSLDADVNFQKGEEELDNGTTSPSRHAAPLFANVKLGYQYKKFNATLYGIFTDELNYANLPEDERSKTYMYALDADGHPYSPAWYTFNLKTGYRFNNYFSLHLGVENITDQRYRPYSSGISGAGRNFTGSVKINF